MSRTNATGGAHAAQLPVIPDAGSLHGELVRIEQRGEMAHATLRDGERTYGCSVSHDLAQVLSRHLFGQQLRLHGEGRWKRSPDGTWELIDFRATGFDVLDGASLAEAAKKLRQWVASGTETRPRPGKRCVS